MDNPNFDIEETARRRAERLCMLSPYVGTPEAVLGVKEQLTIDYTEALMILYPGAT